MGNIIKNGEMFGTDSQTIASLETIGSAATQAYAVGSYLVGVLNGEQKVYEVTAAIAKGNTITVGTNVKATDVATLITALNSNYANLTVVESTVISNPEFGNIHLYKFGNGFKMIQLANNLAPTTKIEYHDIFPDDYVPKVVMYHAFMANDAIPRYGIIHPINSLFAYACTNKGIYGTAIYY